MYTATRELKKIGAQWKKKKVGVTVDRESLNRTCYRNSYGSGEIWASPGRAYRSDIDMKNGGKSFPSGGNPLSEGAETVKC